MTPRIEVTADEVWGYFHKNKADLIDSMHEIASNEEFGVSVYVTCGVTGLPNMIVTADDIEVYSESAVSESDCLKTVRKIYDDYLTEKAVGILSGAKESKNEAEDEVDDRELAIEERELELEEGVYMFFDALCRSAGYPDECYLDEEMIEDCKDHFLEYIARKWGVPIYRPMFLEDENGEEFYSEYPYEEMIFDDEDNPLYK